MRGATVWRGGAAGERRPEEVLPATAAYRPRTRPHICFVAPYAWPVFSRDPHIQVVGGAEVQQTILARLFAADGYRVSMVCLDYGQPERSVVDGVTVFKSFSEKQGMPVLRYLHPRITAMWRAVRAADADIYYYRSASMWVGLLAAWCRRNRRRSIYAGASDRDFLPDEGGQIRYARDRWLYRSGIAGVDAIVAQNEAQLASCRATYGREAIVIPSCYRPPATTRQERRDLVLWVGAVHDNKRPELLLELARRLPRRRFVMIGGPRPGATSVYQKIQGEAKKLRNVEFKGFLPLAEVEPWFDRARVLVNTSVYEGMPNTFLQAWARGVPTLATVDVGAAVNTVVSSVDEMAREVESIFADSKDKSESCKAYFERNHSGAEVLARYARLFDGLAP